MALHSPWCPSRSFSTLDDFGGFMDCQHGKPMWGVGLWDCEVFGVCGKSNEVTEVGYGGLAGKNEEDIHFRPWLMRVWGLGHFQSLKVIKAIASQVLVGYKYFLLAALALGVSLWAFGSFAPSLYFLLFPL
ncbi:hypothetical protein Tco_0009207 [Tanacetum coccineum]